MTRLTTTIREQIRNKAVTAAFKGRLEVLNKRGNALGMEAYEATFPELEREAAVNMPKGWLRQDSCLRFNANGWHASLAVNPAVPVPSERHNCSNLGSLTGDLADRVQALMQDERKAVDDRCKAFAEMDGFLSQFGTIKQMREAWPEGEPFYSGFETERKASGVPAVRVAEINKLLNLSEAA